MTFLARRIEEGARGILTSGALFEALGFDYIGPIDGHNLKELIKTLKNLKDTNHPVLLHITTQKGKGYPPAEKEPEDYHGVKPFCPEDGLIDTIPGVLLYQDVFGKELKNLAQIDERIIGITAAMPTGTGIIPFLKSFPDRFYDVGIAEEHAVVFSAGLASRGLKPYVAIYSNLSPAILRSDCPRCLPPKLPVVFALTVLELLEKMVQPIMELLTFPTLFTFQTS